MPPLPGQIHLILRLGGANHVRFDGYWRNMGDGVFYGGSVGLDRDCKPWLREVPAGRICGYR